MGIKPAILTNLNTTQDALVKQLIDDTRNVFSTMLGLDLLHLPLEVDPLKHFTDCISAMVGLAGTYNGLVSIHQPISLGTKLAGVMLDMELEEGDQDVLDALGEVANMVAGNFKQHLSKGGSDIRLSTPSVVTGHEYLISCKESGSLNLLFDLDEEWLMVSVLLEMD
jgi:chemotaxis protein CheX